LNPFHLQGSPAQLRPAGFRPAFGALPIKRNPRPFAEHAERIELDPVFTIHGREASADLMKLVRQ
jgi:hypothetical protein